MVSSVGLTVTGTPLVTSPTPLSMVADPGFPGKTAVRVVLSPRVMVVFPAARLTLGLEMRQPGAVSSRAATAKPAAQRAFLKAPTMLLKKWIMAALREGLPQATRLPCAQGATRTGWKIGIDW